VAEQTPPAPAPSNSDEEDGAPPAEALARMLEEIERRVAGKE
jgi:hypothetical protein